MRQFPFARGLLTCALLFVGQASAVVFVVNSTADTGGSTCSGTCTLRQAINAANLTTAADTINFSFPINGGFERLIQPATSLPSITQPLTINGYSVLGARENDDPDFSNAQLRIRLDGQDLSIFAGLAVCSSDVTIKGLSITRFGTLAINVGGGGCSNFTGIRILGNFIGLTTSGTVSAPSANGIQCANNQCVIGGTVADRNVVTAVSSAIVVSSAGSSGSTVNGNLVGTDKTGQLNRGGGNGVQLGVGVDNVVVGTAGFPNRIRFGSLGIAAANAGSGNQLQFNLISDHTGLGIDLGSVGITPNDANDLDAGPNDLQNFPVVTAAARVAGGVSLGGQLDVGHPGSLSYQLAVYASSACNASGNGEGERLLGVLTRNLSSIAESFTGTLTTSDPLPPGTVITTTSTRTGVGTSEFSACFPLDPPPLVVNTTDDVADGVCNAAHCSLRDALIVANNATGVATINFAIPPLTGTSELLIQPTAALPIITRSMLIDGYSQPGAAVNTDPNVSNAQLRVRIDGDNAPPAGTGLGVCASDVTIRGLSITRFGSAAIGVGNGGSGFCGPLDDFRAAGNFFGLAANGTTLAASNGGGIVCVSSKCFVGGAVADRNVFAGGESGVSFVNATVEGSVVVGNLFGTDKGGLLDRGSSNAGVALSISARGVTVGSATAPNRFRFNARGVSLLSNAGAGNNLALNRFDSQDALAIDLGTLGITQNDPDDVDGPNANGLQNFPVLTSAERVPGTLIVRGSLDVKADASNTPYTIAVYASASCEREGTLLLGSQVVNLTQASGESFAFALATAVDLVANPAITTTATSSEGTSEFSTCTTATDPPPGIAVDVASDSATVNGGCDIVGDANPCTLREAITLANTQAGADTIRFAILGDGPHVVTPVALLPAITEALTIDGYSQEGAAPNGSASGSDAVLKIELRATGLSRAITVCSPDFVAIRGLAFNSATSTALETKRADSGTCVSAGSLEVEGSFFGMTASGAPLSQAAHILARDTLTTIGGPSLAARNAFANATISGVRIEGAGSTGSRVSNNLFGRTLDPDLPAANGSADLVLVDVRSVDVGGDAANRFSTTPTAIAVNALNTSRLSLWNNSFSDHFAATAIDLGINGITSNDPDDVDGGANDGQNTPVLAVASATPGNVAIGGALDVPAGIAAPALYRLTFYESSSCNDASGPGNGREGQILLASVLVGFTSAAETFSVALPVPTFDPGRFLTATATSPDGSTSEFSNCLAAPLPVLLFSDSFE